MAMRGLRYLMIVPVLLLLASVTMGISNYKKAKEEMRHDLTRALRQFVMDESRQSLLLDTLPSLQSDRVLTLNDVESGFNERLSIIPLKDTSHVAICLLRHDDQDAFREEALVSSDTLLWHSAQQKSGDAVIALKAYANPSLCAVLGHSDQRIPLSGIVLCLLLLSAMAWRLRLTRNGLEMAFVSPTPTSKQISLHLTPMQEQLMDMFAAAPGHILSKESICAALWPKKEHPENTLYTFICRLKTTLKDQSDLDIVNKRGKEYQLVGNSQKTGSQHHST